MDRASPWMTSSRSRPGAIPRHWLRKPSKTCCDRAPWSTGWRPATTPVYGVNTGVGLLADVRVPPEDLEQLQRNVVRSHAAGTGDPLTRETVRAMMLIRANVLAKGYSGIRPVVAERLCEMLDARRHAGGSVARQRGRVGGSGAAGAHGAGADWRRRGRIHGPAHARRRGVAAGRHRASPSSSPRKASRC